MIEYTEAEKKLARTIVDNDVLALLRKVLVEETYAAEETAEKNVLALSNERYGEIMKVNFMVRQHVGAGLGKLKTLARDEKTTKPAVAPR